MVDVTRGANVIWSATPDVTESPYVHDLVGALERSGWSITRLGIRPLLGPPTLVHIQWPEHVSRGDGAAKTALKNLRSLLMTVLLRRHQIVLTVHNLAPHGTHNRLDAYFRGWLERNAGAVVLLVPAHRAEVIAHTSLAAAVPFVHVPNPINSSVGTVGRRADGHLLVLGLLHPYHRHEELVHRMVEAGWDRKLVIAGPVADRALCERLQSLGQEHEWLDVRPGYVTGDELDDLVRGAAGAMTLQLVPFNSGAPFFALPRRLPIAMPESALADMLLDIAGSDWIFPVTHDLDAFDPAALDEWLVGARGEVDLDALSADRAAEAHIELYRSLLHDIAPEQKSRPVGGPSRISDEVPRDDR